MVEVVINNEQDKIEITPVVEETIRKVAEEMVRQENFLLDCEVSITLVENDEIHALNREYRNVDRPTDVLSFPLWEEGEPQKGDFVLLGDIVISAEKSLEQAKEYGHSFLREVAFLTAHGMLHLLGFDHETEEEHEIMRQKEEAVLEKLSLTRQVN